jgi:hypothetical protein
MKIIRRAAFRRALVASLVATVGAAHSAGAETCRPALAFTQVRFSPMKPPTLQRRWTAVVSVDVSSCAAGTAGRFEIVFTRLKEVAPDLEFREQFSWQAPSVEIAVDFWADEAVERYRIDNVTACACRD